MLPGKVAHAELSPLPLKSRHLHYSKAADYRVGAVSLLFYNKANKPHFVLTQRHDYDGAHSGQISFPGGKYEEVDLVPRQTALRETEEEIGVKDVDVNVVKGLSDLYIPPSNFLVYPFVGFLEKEPMFVIDTFEVKELIEVPVEFLFETKIQYKPLSELAGDSSYDKDCPCFVYNDKVVWGATAMILNEMRHILLQ